MSSDHKYLSIGVDDFILQTERLILRQINQDDLTDIFEYASKEKVSTYLRWKPHKTIEDTDKFIQQIIACYQKNDFCHWGIEHRIEKRLIGMCAFVNSNVSHSRGEIGCVLSPNYWRKGYMTEALSSVINFGFTRMKLNRIEALCQVQNIASKRKFFGP